MTRGQSTAQPDTTERDQYSGRLTTGSIRKHLVTQTMPMMIGVGAIMSVGIVDAYFIGKLGPEELAAVAFIFPVTVALASLGVGVIAGIASVVSRAIGSGDMERARNLGNLGIALALAFGGGIALALYALRLPLFRLLQADEKLLPLIDAYMVPYALGFPLLLVLMGMNGALRGQGAAKRAASILITFAAANWALDPILITGAFGLTGFGVAGAAYATIGGWLVGALVAAVSLQSSEITFQPWRLRQCDWAAGSAALGRVAGPAALSNAINPVGLAVLTALLAREGQDAVAGFGAGGRLQSFAVVPLLGLSSSIGAIVGQNWGAGRIDRARRALAYATGFCLLYGLAIAALLVLVREPIAAAFTGDRAVREAIGAYLLIAAWGYAGYGVQIVCNGALNAIDRAGIALLQSAGRVALVMVPFAWLLRPAWGAEAIYAGELAANAAGGLAAAGVAVLLFRKHRA
jgi:putative MATE family efflux protein